MIKKGKENPFHEKLNGLDELDIWLPASDPQDPSCRIDLRQGNGNALELLPVRKASNAMLPQP